MGKKFAIMCSTGKDGMEHEMARRILTKGEIEKLKQSPYVAKATPYLLDETKQYPVKKPLDIYPVYAKYNVSTKTNVHVLDQSFEINTPPNPTYTLEDTEDVTREIYITADTNTYVQDNSDKKFTLKSLNRCTMANSIP